MGYLGGLRAAAIAVAGVLLWTGLAAAQSTEQTPTAPAPSTGGGSTTPTTPGSTRPAPPLTPGPVPTPDTQDRGRVPGAERDRTTIPEARRTVVLSGKVIMDDGAAPPDRVVIECVRNGVARPETYTDSKGRFSFQLGQNSYMMPDARVAGGNSAGRNPGVSSDRPVGGRFGGDRMSCGELRASYPGFRSSVAILAGNQTFYTDVGTLILHRLAHVEGTTISMTSLEAPKDAKKAYEKGMKASEKEKWQASQQEFEKAVQIFPRYAAAWFELGKSMENQSKPAEARTAYGKALEADSKFLSPYLGLARVGANERKWQEVADTTARVIKLNPVEFPEAYYLNSAANYNRRNLDAAEKSGREAIKLDAGHEFPKMTHLLGLILAEKGDFAGAAAQMNEYLELMPNASDAERVKRQMADNQRLALAKAARQP